MWTLWSEDRNLRGLGVVVLIAMRTPREKSVPEDGDEIHEKNAMSRRHEREIDNLLREQNHRIRMKGLNKIEQN